MNIDQNLFIELINRGELKGKDLISLCNSSSRYNKWCNSNNQKLFKQLLGKEFDFYYKPESQRNLYKKFTDGKDFILFNDDDYL